MTITLENAIELVLELASSGALDKAEASQDAEVLEPIRLEQEEAINTVHDFFVNQVFN